LRQFAVDLCQSKTDLRQPGRALRASKTGARKPPADAFTPVPGADGVVRNTGSRAAYPYLFIKEALLCRLPEIGSLLDGMTN
jgi:hypothetical protein